MTGATFPALQLGIPTAHGSPPPFQPDLVGDSRARPPRGLFAQALGLETGPLFSEGPIRRLQR